MNYLRHIVHNQISYAFLYCVFEGFHCFLEETCISNNNVWWKLYNVYCCILLSLPVSHAHGALPCETISCAF